MPALEALAPDLFVVVSYGKIVPAALLALPRSGLSFNIHPSLLPLYRGATPLQSVLRDGRTETGVTIIAMDAGMDTGDVLVQERTSIGAEEVYGELHDRLAVVGGRLLGEAIERLRDGALVRRPQAGMAAESEITATTTRPLRKEDLVLDWARGAGEIVNLIRSLSPQPGARARLGYLAVKVLRAHALDQPSDPARAGEIAGAAGESIVVFAGRGAVAVERLVPPNRGPIDGATFGRSIRAAT